MRLLIKLSLLLADIGSIIERWIKASLLLALWTLLVFIIKLTVTRTAMTLLSCQIVPANTLFGTSIKRQSKFALRLHTPELTAIIHDAQIRQVTTGIVADSRKSKSSLA